MIYYNPTDFDAEIINTGTGLKIKFIEVPTSLTTIPPVSIIQKFGFIPDLPNGGQIPISQILVEHPNWNFYSQNPATGYCDAKYSSGWDGYAKGRNFSGGICAIYKPVLGVEYFIPYNVFYFDADTAPTYMDYLAQYPGTPAYDGSFGAGIVTDGLEHQIGLLFNGVFDGAGKPISIQKMVTVPLAPFTLPSCNPTVEIPLTPTPIVTATTTARKGKGK